MKTTISYGTSPNENDFLSFNIKNKELFKFLYDLGIKIKNTKEGEFSDGMKIELPSGETTIINGSEIWCLPYTETNYISSWIVSTFLWEIEDSFPHKQEDEYSNFTLELINILNKANIITLKDIDDFSRFILIDDIEKSLGYMDGNNIEGYIESVSVSESGNILLYTEFKNNKRLSVNYVSDSFKKEELNEEAYDLTINGGVLNFIVNNGLSPVIIEVWKDGEWIEKTHKQRSKVKVSKELNVNNLEIIDNLKEAKKENDSEIEYEVGEHIFHNVFGEGTILKVDDLILIISFKQGIKRIAKGHHSIKKIS